MEAHEIVKVVTRLKVVQSARESCASDDAPHVPRFALGHFERDRYDVGIPSVEFCLIAFANFAIKPAKKVA